MALVFGDEFTPYISQVHLARRILGFRCMLYNYFIHPCLIFAVHKEPSELFTTSDSATSTIKIKDENTEMMIEVDDDTKPISDDKLFEANSAIAVEKEVAADTIATVFAATGQHFLPYDKLSVLELISIPHCYWGKRKTAKESILEIIKTFYELSEPQDWQPSLTIAAPLHQNVKDLIAHALVPLLDIYETEGDK